jgi:hypothetical protein
MADMHEPKDAVDADKKELAEGDLSKVSGGFAPQPEPPALLRDPNDLERNLPGPGPKTRAI